MIKKDLGFVLKRYNFRETSLIMSLYTYKFGKIRGICKGFYTLKREFASPLDTFSLNEFVFYPKRSEIWLISHVDLVSDYPFLRSSQSKANATAVIFNLIEKTMQLWDTNYYVFNLLRNCLSLLGGKDERRLLYIFLIKFLTVSGFKPELNHCLSCQRTLERDVLFSVAKGGLVCWQCRSKTKDARKISRQTVNSISYIQKTDFSLVYRLKPTYECEQEILYILKEFLAYHFGFDDWGLFLEPRKLAQPINN